jgi:methylthioribose-1-phosphate isomerase
VTVRALEPVSLADDLSAVRIIDQRALPGEFVIRDLRSLDEIVSAIQTLAVRGAPAIGICAAAGLVVVMQSHVQQHREESAAQTVMALRGYAGELAKARPTAVNLAWAVNRCVRAALSTPAAGDHLVARLAREARAIHEEDLSMGRAIAAHGLPLLPDPVRVLTHCNTGVLATGGAGTALAPLYAAHAAGRSVEVFATETRPLLQGARLTSWELDRAGIPVTVIVDSAAGALMRAGRVGAVLVGADRIAANGDVANKIGTYSLAVNAAHHRIPFYVLAPQSTVDAETPGGGHISIELRSREELEFNGDVRVLANGVHVWNPAFDMTPAELVTAIVTDRGVFRPPYDFASVA